LEKNEKPRVPNKAIMRSINGIVMGEFFINHFFKVNNIDSVITLKKQAWSELGHFAFEVLVYLVHKMLTTRPRFMGTVAYHSCVSC